MEFRVYAFEYNGFCGKDYRDRMMLYTAKFLRWTEDPGIGLFECSDGKRRLIPTFALELDGKKIVDVLPKQTYEVGPYLVGPPAHS